MLQLGGSRLKVSPFFKLKYTQSEIIRFEEEDGDEETTIKYEPGPGNRDIRSIF